jgi:hypothetical protein
MTSETRARSLRRLSWILRAGVAIAAVGAVWDMWPAQAADPDYRPRVAVPAFGSGGLPRPRVAFDEGHLNSHTATGSYRPFTRLIERDGYRVFPSEGRIIAEVLRGAEIFVTVNPLGYAGMLQQTANLLGFERMVQLDADAFSDDEVAVLASWVSDGGRALIIADHAPAGGASRRLAAAFDVEMTSWWVEDPEQHDPESGNPATLVFSRENQLLSDHAILAGRDETERINRVMTFTGQALKPGPRGEILLRLSPTAREYPLRRTVEASGRAAAGLAQAVAVRHGRGRVVVLGEAAALSAQRIEIPGRPTLYMGMNRPGIDNQQFALNVMHWLMGLLP